MSAAHSRLELVGIRLKHGACLVAQSEASPPCRGVAFGVESKRAADKLRAGARACVAWVVLAKTVVEAFRSEEVVVHCGGKLVAGHVDNCRIGGGVAPCIGGCHIEHARAVQSRGGGVVAVGNNLAHSVFPFHSHRIYAAVEFCLKVGFRAACHGGLRSGACRCERQRLAAEVVDICVAFCCKVESRHCALVLQVEEYPFS